MAKTFLKTVKRFACDLLASKSRSPLPSKSRSPARNTHHRRLLCEPLEDRRLLSLATTDVGLDATGGNLAITDIAVGGKDDHITLSMGGSSLLVSDPYNILAAGLGTTQVNDHQVSISVADIGGNIQVNTLGGNDTLTVDFGGNPIPAGEIAFDAGGDPGDNLVLLGSGALNRSNYTFYDSSDGSVNIDGFAIDYTGLGLVPITDNLNVANRVSTFTGGAETITLSNSGTPGMTKIESTAGESVTFANPTKSLTVYPGTGDDVVNVNGLGSSFNADLNVYGNSPSLNTLGTFDYTGGALGGEMDINPNGELVYVSASFGQQGLMRVDASNPAAMASTTLSLSYGGGVAVDPVTGRYASTSGGNSLEIFNADGTLYDTQTLASGELGGSLAAGNGTFGISTQGNDHFHIYDQASKSVVFTSGSIATGSRVEYNPATGEYLVRRDGGLNLFFQETSPFDNGTMPTDVNVTAANGATNRLYGQGPGAGQVSMLDGSTHAVKRTISGISNLGDVAVNTLHDQVYIASGTQILVYNGGLTTLQYTYTLPNGYSVRRMEAAQGSDRLYVIGSKTGYPDRLFALLAGGDSDTVNINGNINVGAGNMYLAGNLIDVNNSVTTGGGQTYNAPVAQGANAHLTGSTLTVGPSWNAASHDLWLTFSSAVTVPSVFTNVANVISDGAGGTTIAGSFTTSGNQTYGNAATLTNNATLTSTGGGSISFNSTVNGSYDLGVTTGGQTTFTGAVGGTAALTSLTTNGGGGTAVNGGLVKTSGLQQYTDSMTVGGPSTLFQSTGNAAITFSSTLDGGSAVTVTTGGQTTFTGTVGGTTALTSLTTDGGNGTAINGASVKTTGLQQYTDSVTVGGPATLFQSTGNAAITFSSTLDGGSAVTVTSGGQTTFTGAVGGTAALTSLTTDAAGTTQINGGAVSTTGAQTYNDPVAQGADAHLTGVALTVEPSWNAAAHDLWLTFSSAVTVPSVFTNVANFTSDGTGGTTIAGSFTTGGSQTYGNAVNLTADATLTSTGGADISFNKLDGAHVLQVNTSGVTIFRGLVGSVTPLTSLTTNAVGGLPGEYTRLNGSAINAATVDFKDDVKLGGDVTVGATTVTFEKTVEGSQALVVNA